MDFVVTGGPSITQFHILNDKRHIITKDTENKVALYDVLTVSVKLFLFLHLASVT